MKKYRKNYLNNTNNIQEEVIRSMNCFRDMINFIFDKNLYNEFIIYQTEKMNEELEIEDK